MKKVYGRQMDGKKDEVEWREMPKRMMRRGNEMRGERKEEKNARWWVQWTFWACAVKLKSRQILENEWLPVEHCIVSTWYNKTELGLVFASCLPVGELAPASWASGDCVCTWHFRQARNSNTPSIESQLNLILLSVLSPYCVVYPCPSVICSQNWREKTPDMYQTTASQRELHGEHVGTLVKI